MLGKSTIDRGWAAAAGLHPVADRATAAAASINLDYRRQGNRPIGRDGHLLSQALDHCQIGQSLATLGDPDSQTQADAALDLAVATMRRAGSIDEMPKMYLARARQHRDRQRPDLARSDLDAALAIARRETELHLLEARLRHHQSRPEQAGAALERAESDGAFASSVTVRKSS